MEKILELSVSHEFERRENLPTQSAESESDSE